MATIRTKRWDNPPDLDDGTRILVSRYRPRGLRKENETWDLWLKDLGPSKELHASWYGKRGRKQITWEEYENRYRREMLSQEEAIRNLAAKLNAGEQMTFLCYCDDPSQCHRTLLKDLVESRTRRRTDH